MRFRSGIIWDFKIKIGPTPHDRLPITNWPAIRIDGGRWLSQFPGLGVRTDYQQQFVNRPLEGFGP